MLKVPDIKHEHTFNFFSDVQLTLQLQKYPWLSRFPPPTSPSPSPQVINDSLIAYGEA